MHLRAKMQLQPRHQTGLPYANAQTRAETTKALASHTSPLPITMERCPLEISLSIFSLACTDGGNTGRSLSLVSKHIHAASKPVKLHSMSIRGLRQMKAFANLLESLPPRLRRVHHLSIVDHIDRLPKIYGEITDPGALMHIAGVLGATKNFLEGTTPIKDTEETRSNALHRIINAVSSSIVSLSLSFAACERSPLKLPFHLPRLTELTTFFNFKDPQLAVFTLESFKRFPSLLRWNTGGFGVDPPYLFGHIARLSPRLTHLRLQGIEPYCYPSLARALDTDRRLRAEDEMTPLPVTIKKVFIQPTSLRDEDNLWLKRHNSRIVIQLVDFAGSYFSPAGGKLVENQWLDRVNGGRGCWRSSLKKGRSSF